MLPGCTRSVNEIAKAIDNMFLSLYYLLDIIIVCIAEHEREYSYMGDD